MDVGNDGRPATATREAPSAQTIDLSTPRPIHRSKDALTPPRGSQPAPTGQGLPPLTPSNPSALSRT